MMAQPGRWQRGFTLIEVMVALVVFAVVGFTISSRVSDVVNQTFTLERRLVAHWIVQDQLTRMRLANEQVNDAVPTGRSRERVQMGDREWLLEINVTDSAHPWLRRVDLSVKLVDGSREIGPIDQLTGFLGRY